MLEINNLEVVYHSVVLVLKGISIAVPEGSIVALLGPNGAGKTTTLRAITGLLPIHEGRITKGSITFDGSELSRLGPSQIVGGGIAQAMEGRRIFAELSVEENLLAGAHGRTSRDARAESSVTVQLSPMLSSGSSMDSAKNAVSTRAAKAGLLESVAPAEFAKGGGFRIPRGGNGESTWRLSQFPELSASSALFLTANSS